MKTQSRKRDQRVNADRSKDFAQATELLKRIGSGKFNSRDVAMASILGSVLGKRH